MALSEKKRSNILKTARLSLGGVEKGGFSEKARKSFLRSYKQGGAQGLLKRINIGREKRGIEGKLDPKDIYGKDFTIKNIRQSRSMPEKFATYAARNTKIPQFDYEKRMAELEAEFQPYYDQETADLSKEYDYQGEDLSTQEGDINRQEQYGQENYATQQQRLGLDTEAARRQREFQTQDELMAQNQSLGSRGVTSSSPAAQRLAERLQQRQQFRAGEQDRGFSEASQDIATGQNRFAQGIAEQRRLLGQGRTRLSETRDIFGRQRRQGFQEKVAGATQEQADRFYGYGQ